MSSLSYHRTYSTKSRGVKASVVVRIELDPVRAPTWDWGRQGASDGRPRRQGGRERLLVSVALLRLEAPLVSLRRDADVPTPACAT
jgi:hypothetical protein